MYFRFTCIDQQPECQNEDKVVPDPVADTQMPNEFDGAAQPIENNHNENHPMLWTCSKSSTTARRKKGQMQTKLTEHVEDGQQPKYVTEVVSEVLAKNTKKNQFLQNVGLQNVPTRSRATSGHKLEA